MSRKPDWQLAFVLPNLLLEGRRPSSPELTLGLEGIAIVPASDPRVDKITKWSEPANRFLNSFHDGHSVPITPGVLIVCNDWHSEMNKKSEPVIAFRNAVAVASILPARARRSTGQGGGEALWSDAFDHHAVELSLDGSHLDLFSPALSSYYLPLDELSLTCDVRLRRCDPNPIDEHLAIRLGQAWNLRYRQGRRGRETTKLFRSLESAYEALAIKAKHYSSIYEGGLTTVPWTTAVQVLASPRARWVKPSDCTDLIGRAPVSSQSKLHEYTFDVTQDGKKKTLNLPQRIFDDIYKARSKFVHGDEVSLELLLPFGEEVLPLPSLASSVYRMALIAYLDEQWPQPKNDLTDLVRRLLPNRYYENHLLKAIDR